MAKEKPKRSSEETIRTIRRVTRKKYTADDKIRIVLEGLRGGSGIRELCRREGIATNLYYSGSKEFLEAGKQRLLGDTQRQATSREVSECAPKSINSSTWWRSCRSRTACSTPALVGGAREKTCGARNETAAATPPFAGGEA